jgi:hypothetical protein
MKTMKTYLNVYDYNTPEGILNTIKSLRFDGLRRDVESPNEVDPILQQSIDFNFETILLLNTTPEITDLWVPFLLAKIETYPLPVKVEIGNEWDLNTSPSLAREAWIGARAYLGNNFITGGISSLSNTALSWLKEALGEEIFPNIGFHPYRTTKPAGEDIIPYLDRLKALSPSSKFWNTECGWHTCKSKLSCFRSVQFDDFQVEEFLRKDIGLHSQEGIESYTVYQLNDGPSSNYEDHFGIRRLDGSLKPSAYVLT